MAMTMSLPRQLLAHPPPSSLPPSLLNLPFSSLSRTAAASSHSASWQSGLISPAAYRATWHRNPPRTFSSARASAQASSRRPLVTSAASAPQQPPPPADLDTIPTPPPRNADAPAVPGVHDIRPPADLRARPASNLEQRQGAEPVACQVPASTATESASTTTSAAASVPVESAEKKPRPKSKLRPLRAALKLTPAAVAHIRDLLDQPEPKLLRIGTRRRGCSGLAYHLEYVDRADKFDEVVKQDGVEVLIEGRALLTVLGSTMDWVDEKLGSRFVFTNPNIKEQCGCGESFMV